MALRRLLLLYSRQLHHPIIIPTSKPITTPFKPPTTHHHHFHSTSLSLAQTTATPDTARALNIKKSPKKKADSKPKKSRKSPVQFQNSRFSKQRKGRVSGSCSCGGDDISFGTFGLRALEPGWLTARAIRAGRGAMARYARGGGKLWVRVIPDKSVTTRPAETRMGRGKGAVAFMVGCVKPGRIIYEMAGVTEKVAREAFLLAASKMPIRTKFVSSSSSSV